MLSLGHAEPGQRKCDRLADAAGADHGDDGMRGILHQPGDGPGKPRGVGVISDQPAVANHDGIDRADGARAWRQFVEQGNHRFLVGKGDVDPGKPETPDAVQQQPQFFASGAGDFDQLVVAMDAQRFGGALMHRRRRRMRNRRPDQAGEKPAVGRSKGAGGGRAHDLVVRVRGQVGERLGTSPDAGRR